jgi:hypothetical protein
MKRTGKKQPAFPNLCHGGANPKGHSMKSGSLYCRDRDRFLDVMRHAIALNGSFFNTQRMVLQYVLKAYLAHRCL